MKQPVSENNEPGRYFNIVYAVVCAIIIRSLVGLVGFSIADGQTPIKIVVDATAPSYAVPIDFAGLGFETKSVLPNTYGVSGYFFSPENKGLITLFRNAGVRHIRIGGGTVDGSGTGEQCTTPIPDKKDIDQLFGFAKRAQVKAIYSLRLLNLSRCADPDLATKDAEIARYIWHNYKDELDSFSIGNEPDVREFHTYPGHPMDPFIYEAKVGVAGSAYPSYFADWQRFAAVVHKAVPDAKISGPETAVSDQSSYTPNPTTGISWTQKFAADAKGTGFLGEALQHHYVWGSPGDTTATEAIDDMLSDAWDSAVAVGTQRARNGKTVPFHPYPYLYTHNLAPLASYGVRYRMTEANDCLHGVQGASNGYASALWALDYMHWWAEHGAAGINFHNNPWLPTDTVTQDPTPCSHAACGNYRVNPKAYGIKAFDVGSHGYIMPLSLSNPRKINLTAYAIGTDQNIYVTLINKTHATTHDVTAIAAIIAINGFRTRNAEYITLSNGDPGNAASMSATLGGAALTDNAVWRGKWTPVRPIHDRMVRVPVQSTSAVIVKISLSR